MDDISEYDQHVIRLAEANVTTGVVNEPRVFYDTVTLGNPFVEVDGHPNVFQNGEDFPVRVTHILAAMARLDAEGEPTSPAEIQRVGMQLKFHDQYYMNPYAVNPFNNTSRQLMTPLPAWALNPVAASDIISFGTSAWRFQRPFILSARDSIRVDVQVDGIGSGDVFPVTVSFNGIGAKSRVPYFLTGTIYVNTAQRQTISTENYQNDGSEPIIVTSMTPHCGASLDEADPTGDISRVSIGVRQIGNGTNQSWVTGPTNDPPLVADLVPAQVLGQLSGRAIVHRVPGDGILWAPGEGIQLRLQNLNPSGGVGNRVVVGMLGYVAVT